MNTSSPTAPSIKKPNRISLYVSEVVDSALDGLTVAYESVNVIALPVTYL